MSAATFDDTSKKSNRASAIGVGIFSTGRPTPNAPRSPTQWHDEADRRRRGSGSARAWGHDQVDVPDRAAERIGEGVAAGAAARGLPDQLPQAWSSRPLTACADSPRAPCGRLPEPQPFTARRTKTTSPQATRPRTASLSHGMQASSSLAQQLLSYAELHAVEGRISRVVDPVDAGSNTPDQIH